MTINEILSELLREPKKILADSFVIFCFFWLKLFPVAMWKSTFVVIILNQELSSTCPRKNHSQHHCDTLTLSGGRIQLWMCCWNAILIVIGTLMVTGANGNLGLFSRSSQNEMKNSQTDIRLGERLTKIQATRSSTGLSRNRSSTMRES